MGKPDYKKTIYKISIASIIGNFILTAAKIIGGILAKSSSLISDGIHSGSDVLSTIVVMVGAKISVKEPDKDHPYGHERLESIASIILAMLLIGTAFILGYNGVLSIIEFAKGNIPERNSFIYLALGLAIASIVIKFLMFLYAFINAKKIKSTSLKADAYHHLSDSLSSIGSVLGIIGIMIGGYFAILDPISSLIIALFIIKVAYDILKESISQLVDKTVSNDVEEEIKKHILKCEGVKGINWFRTRLFGAKYFVEVAIKVDSKLTVKEGHKIAHDVHHDIEDNFPDAKHCSVHVDPDDEMVNY